MKSGEVSTGEFFYIIETIQVTGIPGMRALGRRGRGSPWGEIEFCPSLRSCFCEKSLHVDYRYISCAAERHCKDDSTVHNLLAADKKPLCYIRQGTNPHRRRCEESSCHLCLQFAVAAATLAHGRVSSVSITCSCTCRGLGRERLWRERYKG